MQRLATGAAPPPGDSAALQAQVDTLETENRALKVRFEPIWPLLAHADALQLTLRWWERKYLDTRNTQPAEKDLRDYNTERALHGLAAYTRPNPPASSRRSGGGR